MRISTKSFACALLFTFGTSAASAASITMQTFDTDPVLSTSQQADAWYTDRYAPAGFTSETFDGGERLRLQLSDADDATNRPGSYSGGFYNTQGRKFDTTGATEMSIDMYIDAAFEQETGRVGGLWATAVNAANVISFYPILEFINGGFSFWDGAAFQDLGTPTAFTYDSWVNIGFSLDAGTGILDIFAGDISTTVDVSGTTSFSNAILQGINTDNGINRDIYFDNFSASTADIPAAVPLPASLPLLLGGLAVIRISRRRCSA